MKASVHDRRRENEATQNTRKINSVDPVELSGPFPSLEGFPSYLPTCLGLTHLLEE